MSIIVDTSVWSLALRRNHPDPNSIVVQQFQTLVLEGLVVLMGAIRQEILSGLRSSEQFQRLQTQLRAFPDVALETEDYELAADFFNRCRHNGVQGSNTDFLISAVAHRRSHQIFTTDKDWTVKSFPCSLQSPSPR